MRWQAAASKRGELPSIRLMRCPLLHRVRRVGQGQDEHVPARNGQELWTARWQVLSVVLCAVRATCRYRRRRDTRRRHRVAPPSVVNRPAGHRTPRTWYIRPLAPGPTCRWPSAPSRPLARTARECTTVGDRRWSAPSAQVSAAMGGGEVKPVEASVNPDKGDLGAVTGGNLALETHGHSRGAAS